MAAIGTLEDALALLGGAAGTMIARNAGEVEWYDRTKP
jgi:hypothetical protein